MDGDRCRLRLPRGPRGLGEGRPNARARPPAGRSPDNHYALPPGPHRGLPVASGTHASAGVYMLEKGIERSRAVWEDRTGLGLFTNFLTRHGMGTQMAEKASTAMRSCISLPQAMLRLYPGEELVLGEGVVKGVGRPGLRGAGGSAVPGKETRRAPRRGRTSNSFWVLSPAGAVP